MKTEPYDCLTVADFCVDLLVRGAGRPQFGQVEQLVNGYTLALGGSAAIVATQMARLGARVGVVGVSGRDQFGRFGREELARAGVDTRWLRESATVPTGLGVALCAGEDRAILTTLGTIAAVTPAEVAAVAPECARHWHIASYFLLEHLREMWPPQVRRLRRAGVTVSLDTNWDPAGRWAGALELLPLVDVFLPNAAEACAIAGDRDWERAGRRLAATGALVVVKTGSEGAVAFSADGTQTALTPAAAGAAVPAEALVDTVGAGDCFDAGFLRAWQLGYSLEACLRWGLRCGAASVRAAGGIAGQWQAVMPAPQSLATVE